MCAPLVSLSTAIEQHVNFGGGNLNRAWGRAASGISSYMYLVHWCIPMTRVCVHTTDFYIKSAYCQYIIQQTVQTAT